MKLKIVVLMAVCLSSLVPTVEALGGTPPSFVCQYVQPRDSTYHYGFGVFLNLDPESDSSNNVYAVMIREREDGNGEPWQIARVTSSCAATFAFPSQCSLTGGACRISDIHVDVSSRLVYTYTWIVGGVAQATHVEIRNKDTLALIATSPNMKTAVSPSWTDIRGVTSFHNGSTSDINYLAMDEDADRIARFNHNLTHIQYTAASSIGSGRLFECCLSFVSPTHVLVSGGPDGTWAKFDVSSGTFSFTSNNGGLDLSQVDFLPPLIRYDTADSAVGAITSGSIGSTSVSYSVVNTVTGVVTGPTAFADNQIRVSGSLRDTDAMDYDIDGNDNLLVCGVLTTDDFAFFAHFKPSNNTQFWNVTLVESGQIAIGEGPTNCGITRAGNPYIIYTYRTTGDDFNWVIQLYNGGGFEPPVDRRTFVTFPEPEAVEGNIIRKALDNFNVNWGFDGSVLFGLLIVSMVTIGFASYGKSTILAGVGVVLGVIAAVMLELFDVWVLMLVAFTVIAVAGVKLFDRGDE